MAWAEYYRQQAAYYGQTLGQAQAHSQVCICPLLLPWVWGEPWSGAVKHRGVLWLEKSGVAQCYHCVISASD